MEDKNDCSSLPMLCKTGCGFFASMEGMCSVCYKQHISKMRERDNAAVAAGSSALQGTASFQTSLPPSKPEPSVLSHLEDNESIPEEHPPVSMTASPLNSAQPTTPSVSTEAIEPAPSKETEEVGASPDSSLNSSKKRNRCHFCNKRVGLLGCECRCGGVFCGLHRYSDTHECPFDYKEMAQSEIRKNNPQISSNKINKI